jgi:hypothetical protein
MVENANDIIYLGDRVSVARRHMVKIETNIEDIEEDGTQPLLK